MTARSSAGSSIKISAGNPATFDAAGFGALSFTSIGEVTNIGDFGRVYQLIKHNPLATRDTKKLKGSYDPGSAELQLALDNADAGQVLAKAASVSDSAYSFVVTSQDGHKWYFQALVIEFQVGIGAVNDITKAKIKIEITSNSAGLDFVEV